MVVKSLRKTVQRTELPLSFVAFSVRHWYPSVFFGSDIEKASFGLQIWGIVFVSLALAAPQGVVKVLSAPVTHPARGFFLGGRFS